MVHFISILTPTTGHDAGRYLICFVSACGFTHLMLLRYHSGLGHQEFPDVQDRHSISPPFYWALAAQLHGFAIYLSKRSECHPTRNSQYNVESIDDYFL